ncbi:MAG: DUF362 domain-containing protein [Nitrososphaerota archaeon]|uniref:DUF362 domain-containing protein n=1 Tax=Candidatus Bathycorpusculum sp. TaxID=2994959 RepID=UPI002831DA07|nr:DUF362 domain-containing protein [Candidatus Termitimicrobium sp.]MCL2431300.1 DUF362 domain-containing protein [Candidatus Termitimicrobium sp.]MDR0493833.1 DUF362 domain-containing protein [Nitrososphaerota archaeon]
MSLVSLVKIPLNTDDPLKQAIAQALSLIDYTFDKNVHKVVIKPNLCYYWDATTGQTTSPQFVGSLIDLIRGQIHPDVDIAIIESDASAMRCKYAFRMLGYTKLAEEKHVRLVNLTEDQATNTNVHCGTNSYDFMVPKTIQEAELKINIAHIKYTVNPIKLTCGLKNIFGCNPAQKKFKYHNDLGNVIVALNKVMPFDLTLVDSNIAAGVQPRRMGLVMASQDPVALDSAAAKIAWLDPAKIPYFKTAEQEGIGKRTYILRGEPLESFRAIYPKPPFNMKLKKQLKRTLVTVGLGKRMGLE